LHLIHLKQVYQTLFNIPFDLVEPYLKTLEKSCFITAYGRKSSIEHLFINGRAKKHTLSEIPPLSRPDLVAAIQLQAFLSKLASI